ncbi:MAG: hypothetical protein PW735_03645 [Acidobacteriaceae bacterium]|nr:hypothetical protein [Acidobacteriaceae bacterium]
MRPLPQRTTIALFALLLSTPLSLSLHAQQSAPTDNSAQASPLGARTTSPTTDGSNEASPLPDTSHGGLGVNASLPAGTAIPVALVNAISSGSLHNGQQVAARTTAAIRTPHGTLPAGTAAIVTVVATSPAGRVISVGEFSLELSHLGSSSLYTDIQTYRGKPGTRDLPDALPSLGSEASLPADAPLTFRIMALATAAEQAPADSGLLPGGINGIADATATSAAR